MTIHKHIISTDLCSTRAISPISAVSTSDPAPSPVSKTNQHIQSSPRVSSYLFPSLGPIPSLSPLTSHRSPLSKPSTSLQINSPDHSHPVQPLPNSHLAISCKPPHVLSTSYRFCRPRFAGVEMSLECNLDPVWLAGPVPKGLGFQ